MGNLKIGSSKIKENNGTLLIYPIAYGNEKINFMI
jgi:hypothetical protein